MKTLKIYDPATCCSTSVSGSDVNTELVQFDRFLKNLDRCKVTVERFNFTPESSEYTKEPVAVMLKEKGIDALPFVMIDDEVISVGGYPYLGKLSGLLDTSEISFGMPDCSGCSGCG